MAKSPLILAALAKAAAPAIDLVQAHTLSGAQTGLFDSALLKGSNGQDYVVRTPASTAGALELDIETQVLRLLGPESRARLPFKVTTILGETRDAKRNRVVVFEYLYGQPIRFDRVTPGGLLSNSLGAAIASIHALDTEVFRSAGLPEFSPAETARRLMNELDSVSALGLVPPVLLERWEAALEDVALFRYQPTVVHGELSTETVLQSDETVYSVLNWGALHIGDPAEDLAWIAAASVPDLLESVRLSYFATIGAVDATIAARATLYGELTHARWLLHGKNVGDQEIIDEALASLELIASEVREGATLSLSSTPLVSSAAVAGAFLAEPAVTENEEMPASHVDTSTTQIPLAEQPEAEDISQSIDEDLPTYEEVPQIDDFEPLVAESKDSPVTEIDDRTKEIELPEKTDNELF